tara:strand:- start:352 stop:558 length:207 start_codon:yes stop_codon:yes gene_type:complete
MDGPVLILTNKDLCPMREAAAHVVGCVDRLNAALADAWEYGVDATIEHEELEFKVKEGLTVTVALEII